MLQTNAGVRRLTPGALLARAHTVEKERGVGRKELIAVARECGEGLELRASVRLVLTELAACYGEQPVDRGLMVWPSNDYLARRTGLGERTIRKCLGELARLSLLEPVDSANRKRFAVRAAGGQVVDAYGFNLAPLYARRAEFTAAVMMRKKEREEQDRRFDEVTICRKASAEAVEALCRIDRADVAEGFGKRLDELLTRTPRRGSTLPMDALVAEWRDLRAGVENGFLDASRARGDSGSAGPACRHIEQDIDLSAESCSNGRTIEGEPVLISATLVVEACPEVRVYDDAIASQADVLRVGLYLRPAIGASPDAWAEAVRAIGAGAAAALVLYVLQLAADQGGRVGNPGGLFRDLARRVAAGTVDLGMELARMRRKRVT